MTAFLVNSVTVQNEPRAHATVGLVHLHGAAEEREYACDYLRNALDSLGGEKINIFIWDHNKEKLVERTEETLAEKGAAEKIQGIAFHWYTGDHFEEVQEARRMFPDKTLVSSEGCVEYSRTTSKDPHRGTPKYTPTTS